MKAEIIKKVNQLFSNEHNDREMNNLGRNLFWGNDPTYEDYIAVGGVMDKEQFDNEKSALIEKFAGKLKHEI